MNHPDLKTLSRRLGYSFRNDHLLQLALTHKSYSNENPHLSTYHNERLEFLGDAVLDFIISDLLMQRYPELPEGDLSKMRASLVSETALATLARKLELGHYLIMGKGEHQSGGQEKDSLLSDALEAVIAAIYLDSQDNGGIQDILRVITHLFSERIENADRPQPAEDYKTELQEHIQKLHKETVRYNIIHESGPDHDKWFEAAVLFEEKELGRGQGRSKKAAEQAAAHSALAQLKHEV